MPPWTFVATAFVRKQDHLAANANLFVASSVFNEPILKVIRSVIPFTLLMLLALAIITGFEPLSTALLAEDTTP